MFQERRKAVRRGFNRFGRFHAEGGSRDCLIVNISDNGVRLHVERGEVPEEFTLVIDGVDPPRRACRVVWRLGCEVGARFTDLPAPVARHRARESARG